MVVWRPAGHVRVIVIGVAWNRARLLAVEVTNDEGAIKGVRPLGGGIELGESREAALRREFQEELGVEIAIVGPWHVIENIYEHEGHIGHEIVFAAEITLSDPALYAAETIVFREHDLTPCRAGWFAPADLAREGIALFPNGLADIVGSGGKT